MLVRAHCSGALVKNKQTNKWSRSYFTTFWLQNVVISCASSWFFSNRSNKLSSWYFFLIGQINFKSAWLTLIDWYNHTICKRIVRVTILLHVSSIASPACHEFDALGNISLYKRIEDVIVVRNEYWLEWYLTSRIKAPVVCHGTPILDQGTQPLKTQWYSYLMGYIPFNDCKFTDEC